MTKFRHIAALAVIPALLLTGCTGSTDPATAGLFDNVRNLSSGEYDRQIGAKEAEAAQTLASNRQLEAENARLDRQRQANARSIAGLQSEIASVRAEAAAARARVEGNPAAEQQLNALTRQLNAVEASAQSGGDPNVVRSELRQIRGAIRALSV